MFDEIHCCIKIPVVCAAVKRLEAQVIVSGQIDAVIGKLLMIWIQVQ